MTDSLLPTPAPVTADTVTPADDVTVVVLAPTPVPAHAVAPLPKTLIQNR